MLSWSLTPRESLQHLKLREVLVLLICIFAAVDWSSFTMLLRSRCNQIESIRFWAINVGRYRKEHESMSDLHYMDPFAMCVALYSLRGCA